jgi:WD40 repeat protein/DNA-binding SARP family transcriptional activator
MEIRVLGPLEVLEDEHAIDVSAPMQRRLLTVLALSAGKVVSSDRLIDELWGDSPPTGGSKTLQYHVSKLRDALRSGEAGGCADAIVTRSGGYVLDIDPDDVDAVRFEHEVIDARRIIEYDPGRAAAKLRDALSLWRGPVAEELVDSPSLELEARRLVEQRIGCLEDRIAADLVSGRHADVVPELEALTAEHPLRERLWALLMVAFYRSDRQAEALRAYERLRKHLAEELGIVPSPDLRRLEESILRQDPELGVPEGLRRPASLRGYELAAPVGEGAFGVVWKATQVSVEREVALKIVRPEHSNRPGSVLGFQAQAQILAALDHPHIVPVYDFWRDPDGAYLVMPLMSGGNLAALDTSDWDTDRAVSTLEQLAGALAHAHRLGVVHADLHPGNVLFDADGNAYLADFGLAVNLSGGTNTPPTAYSSPEQLGGGTAYRSSDVYGLARLAIRIFTGADPAAGDRSVHGTIVGLRSAVDTVLRRAMDPDPERRHADANAFLQDFRAAMGADPQAAVVARNPYKGLRPFSESDAPDFFGRQSLVDELVRFVEDHRLTAVVGASGSGKSSVVNAGLIPALRAGAVPGSEGWLITSFYPGLDPFGAFTEALQAVAVDRVPDLRSSGDALASSLGRFVPAGDVLVVIDQFEELFTLVDSDDVRDRFLDLLASLVAETSRVRLVLTLRADHLGSALEHGRFGASLRNAVVGLTALAPDELARAITSPALNVGVDVAPELVADLVGDVVGQPGGLPLMEYALMRLFEERQGSRLEAGDYRSVGGLGEALAGWAEDLFSSLDQAAREAFRSLLLDLVSVDEEGHATRRRVPIPELYSLGLHRETIDGVLQRFEDFRLLSTDHDPESRTPTVEIAHEALLERWQRLRAWIDERRDMLGVQRTFRRAVDEWEAADRDPDYLLTGGRLQHFESWAHSTDLPLADRESAYLESSRALEQERTAVRRRTRRLVVVGLATIALIAVAFGIAALLQRGRAIEEQRAAEQQAAVALEEAARADEQARLASNAEAEADAERDRASAQELVARARGLAGAAMTNLDDDPELALLLAIEAVEVTGDEVLREAEEALHAAVNTSRLVFTVSVEQWDRTVAYDPSGDFFYTGGHISGEIIDVAARRSVSPITIETETGAALSNIAKLAIAGADDELLVVSHYSPGMISVLDRETLEPLFILEGHEVWVTDLAVSGDGSILASADPYQGSVLVWDLESRERIAELDCDSACGGVAISDDGELVAAGGAVWNVASGETVHTGLVEGVSRDVELVGNRLFVVADSFVHLIDLDSGETVAVYAGHSAEVAALDVSPDGAWLASGGNDGRIFVWDATGENSAPMIQLPAEQGTVWDVKFSPDGRLLTSTSGRQQFDPDLVSTWPRDWQARTWDVSIAGRGELVAVAGRDAQLAFLPTADHVVFADATSGAGIWSVQTAAMEVEFATPPDAPVDAIAVSPDGRNVALAGVRDGGGWAAVFDAVTGRMIDELLASRSDTLPQALAFSPDGSRLALVATGFAAVWDTATWEIETDLSALSPAFEYSSVAFLPDSSHLLTQFLPFTEWGWPSMHLWDLEGGEIRSELDHVPRAGRGDVAFSPDGRLLASAGIGRPQLTDPFTGRVLTRLDGAPPHAVSVAFSPDADRVATGEADGSVRLWDRATGEETLVLEGHDAMVVDVAFSQDGSRLASVDVNGVSKVWVLDVDELLGIAKERVERELTAVECRVYVVVGCPPAPGPERLIPASGEWDAPFGIEASVWDSAIDGGSWTEAGTLAHDGDHVFLSDQRRLLLFNGGMTGASWAFDFESTEWREITSMPGVADPTLPPDVEPPVASIGALVSVPDRDEVLATRIDDGATLAYSVASDDWSQVAPIEEAFADRYGMGAAYDSESNVVVLFGGAHWGRTDEGKHVGFADTWIFDVESSTWSEVSPALSPPARIGPAFVYDPDAERIVMFGGHTRLGGDVLGDTWVYDADANTWAEIDTTLSPPARSGHVAWYDRAVRSTFVFGGGGEWSSWPPLPWTALGGEELWGFDAGTETWTLYRSDANPGYRLPGGVFYDEASSSAWLLSGEVYDADRRFQGETSDIWMYRHDGSPAPIIEWPPPGAGELEGFEGLGITVEESSVYMWANSPGDEIVFDILVENQTVDQLSGFSVTFDGESVVENLTLDGSGSWTGQYVYTASEDDFAGLRFDEMLEVTAGAVQAWGTDANLGNVIGRADATLTAYRVRACPEPNDDGSFHVGPYLEPRLCSFTPELGTFWTVASTESRLPAGLPTVRDGVPGNWCNGAVNQTTGRVDIEKIAYFPEDGVCLGGGENGATIPVRDSDTFYLYLWWGTSIDVAPCETCS